MFYSQNIIHWIIIIMKTYKNLIGQIAAGAKIVAVFLYACVAGCESDPILAPQGNEGTTSGSYAAVKFESDEKRQASRDDEAAPAPLHNPELF